MQNYSKLQSTRKLKCPCNFPPSLWWGNGVILSPPSNVYSPNSVGPCDRQPALPLAEPGQWETVNLYGWTASDHWTKWALLFFILCNQARGWWSVWIVKCWPQRYVSMEYLQSPHHTARHSFLNSCIITLSWQQLPAGIAYVLFFDQHPPD